MCGIMGYSGKRPCLPILLDGLERLEYRGYDSAGVAWPTEADFCIVKTAGRLSALRAKLSALPPPQALCGIGHTRWATHGVPSAVNSHPHAAGRVCLVHNGIIENHAQLRQELPENGAECISDTDTEVLVRLLDALYDGDPLDTLRRTLPRVRGSYALAILFAGDPGALWAVRRESPLVIGCGCGECFASSDISALPPHTDRILLPDDSEIVRLCSGSVNVYGFDGKPLKKAYIAADRTPDTAEKNGWPHFMLKEIHEQPEALHRTVEPLLRDGLPCFDRTGADDAFLAGIERIRIVGCGTAYHAARIGKTVLERLAHIPVQAEIASEFRYADPLLTPRDLVLVISQSGETLDTLAALRLARQRGCPTLAIVNVPGSSIAREADAVVYTRAGPEIAVASTKAFTTQLAVLYLLAFRLALLRGTAKEARLRRLCTELAGCGTGMRRLLAQADTVRQLAEELCGTEHLFFLGRGLDYPLALEGSLKLKEISYIHSEGYPAGELKHGSIALITHGTPVIALATQDAVLEKTLSNLGEARARGAAALLFCMEDAAVPADAAERILRLPSIHELLAPLEAVIPLQLFAYYSSVLRGCDVDKPRNLAKSVTVE